MNSPSPWIEKLNLMPHPEGGFYREFFRSAKKVSLGQDCDDDRNLSTCIYYLLPSNAFSAFHRLSSDEIWLHLSGGRILIHVIDEQGRYSVETVSSDPRDDGTPSLTISANKWFAAEPAPHSDSLAACFVSPGFDFKDFELAEKDKLADICPAQAELIDRLTIR